MGRFRANFQARAFMAWLDYHIGKARLAEIEAQLSALHISMCQEALFRTWHEACREAKALRIAVAKLAMSSAARGLLQWKVQLLCSCLQTKA